MQRDYISRKRKYSTSTSTDAAPGKQSTSMPRRTYARARTYGRRGKGRSRTGGRTRRASTPSRAAVRQTVLQRPVAKHLLWSDNGVTGGSASIFATNALINATPLIQLLNGCVRGMTVQTRIGDICKVSKIHLKMRTTYGTAIDGDVIIKWILFAEKNSQGFARTASNFSSTYFGDGTPQTNAIPNHNNKDVSLFRILKKGTQYMRASMATVIEIRDWSIFYAPKTPLRVNYTLGNAGTIADIDGNAIYLYMYTDNTTGGATGVYSFMEGNVYYHDA